jgi:hypothetical protein
MEETGDFRTNDAPIRKPVFEERPKWRAELCDATVRTVHVIRNGLAELDPPRFPTTAKAGMTEGVGETRIERITMLG